MIEEKTTEKKKKTAVMVLGYKLRLAPGGPKSIGERNEIIRKPWPELLKQAEKDPKLRIIEI